MDGISYPSSCHAAAFSVHVDYPGRCVWQLERPSRNRLANQCYGVHLTRRCQKLAENCTNQVTPHGACCPICGKLSLRPCTFIHFHFFFFFFFLVSNLVSFTLLLHVPAILTHLISLSIFHPVYCNRRNFRTGKNFVLQRSRTFVH